MTGEGLEPLAPGTRVALRGVTWRVEQRTPHADCVSVRLRACGRFPGGSTQTFLLPFDHCLRLDGIQPLRVVGRRRFFHVLRQHVLATSGFGETRTVRTSNVDLQAFQLEPVLAMLRHARLRLFIADSVGLGKTIQAGLVLNELSARSDAFRALVVVPAGLRAQWQEELRVRFALEVVMADGRWLISAAQDLPADINPWSLPGVYVASHDLLKQPEVLHALADVRWDLLIADEVHNAGPGTARLTALQALGARSRRIILLSATPPDSEPHAMRALAGVGRFEGERPMTILRRSRLDVGDFPTRRTVWLPVRLSSAERLMHARLDKYAALVWRESKARQDPAARLAVMVLKKRALSTASSLLASVRRRIALLGTGCPENDRYSQLSLFEEEALADDADEAALAAPGLAEAGVELTLLAGIEEAAGRAASAESKIRALRRLLKRVSEPVIVFTEYRDTVAHLAEALAGRQPAILTGLMSPAERTAVQRQFSRDGSLLLATDAASEGLNLHQRCRLVVHFELPWVPRRLEQRAGRVDRLGQRRRVHEIVLVARHTSERYVLGPLVRRIRTAMSAGAPTSLASLTESAVASGVLGREPLDMTPPPGPAPFESLSLRNEAEAECKRIASLRTIASRWPSARGVPPRDLVIGRKGWRTNVATVLIRTRVEGNGTLLDERLVVVLVTCTPNTRPESHQRMRTIVEQLVGQLTPARIAGCGALDEAMQVEKSVRQSFSELAARELRLVGAETGTHRSLQAGLFDRRAVRQADARDRAATSLMEETQARVRALTELDLRREFEVLAVDFGNWTWQ